MVILVTLLKLFGLVLVAGGAFALTMVVAYMVCYVVFYPFRFIKLPLKNIRSSIEASAPFQWVAKYF